MKREEKFNEDLVLAAYRQFGSDKKAADALGIDKRDFISLRRQYGITIDDRLLEVASAALTDNPYLGWKAEPLSSLVAQSVPTDISTQMQKAQKYRGQDELVGQICDIKQEFGAAGFHPHSVDKTTDKWYKNICREHDIDGVVLALWDYYVTTDNVVLHWKEENGQLEYVMALNPANLEVVPLFNGEKIVYCTVSDRLKELIQYPKTDYEKKLVNKFPLKWIKAAKRQGEGQRKDQVMLNPSEGEKVIIRNRMGFNDQFIRPRMCRIFRDLALRNLLIDGDFTVAYLIKFVITHITAGESITSGPLAGKTKNWAKKPDLDAILDQFRRAVKAMVWATPHHVKLNFLFPDTEVFSPDKYKAVDTRILRWGGIGLQVLIGEGQSYATGYLNVKRLIAEIYMGRNQVIGRLLEQFFTEIKPRWIRKDYVPKVIWNEQMLKEPRQLLQEVQYLVNQGLLDVKDGLESFGWHSNIVEEKKKRELEEVDIWRPIFEQKQGLLSEQPQRKATKNGEPGKPKGDVPTPEEGPPEYPKPSTANYIAELIDKGLLEFDQEQADYTSPEGEYHHIESKKYAGQWASDEIVGSKKLSNGIVLRFGRLKNGKSAVRIYLLPKSRFKTLKDAQTWVKKHEG